MVFYENEVLAAKYGSQGLAHLSTAYYVGGLNFRVRDGSGCVPAAMAANTCTCVYYWCTLLDIVWVLG
jgi:hypothetical protein